MKRRTSWAFGAPSDKGSNGFQRDFAKSNAPARGGGVVVFPVDRLLVAAIHRLGATLVVLDLLRHLILLAVDLLSLLRRQVATVGGSVIADFVVDVALLIFQPRGLAGIQLPFAGTAGDAVLQVLSPLPDFSDRVRRPVELLAEFDPERLPREPFVLG